MTKMKQEKTDYNNLDETRKQIQTISMKHKDELKQFHSDWNTQTAAHSASR